MSQRLAATQLKISQPLLCKILKNRDELMRRKKENENTECKRNRSGKDANVEKALRIWFENMRERGVPVNGPLMQRKAEDLASEMGKPEFTATNGWFQRWRKRENIVFKKVPREQKDADQPAAGSWIHEVWPELFSLYSPENVYIADETGLYFQALPEHTHLCKHENLKVRNIYKEHVTILVCCSMFGKKQKLLVIGKSKNPQCFKGINSLPVDYFANESAWMTTIIFNEWLRKWDDNLQHDILLLVDNCTAHVVNVTLKHINVVVLPANTTSLLEPCIQGIIPDLKARYRQEMRAQILEEVEDFPNFSAKDIAKKFNLLDVVHLLNASWDQISETSIRNCFPSEEFRENSETEIKYLIESPSDMTTEEFESWMEIDKNIQIAEQLTEAKICEIKKQNGSTVADESDEECQYLDKPPTNTEMRNALKVLKQGVQHYSKSFAKHYEYERFINELLRKNSR